MIDLAKVSPASRKVCAAIVVAASVFQGFSYLLFIYTLLRKLDLKFGLENGAPYLDFAQTTAVINIAFLVLIIGVFLALLCLRWGIQLYRNKLVPLLFMAIVGMFLSPFGILIALSTIFILWKCAQKEVVTESNTV